MKTLGSVCIWLVCFGILVPNVGNCAEAPTAASPFIQDVALDDLQRLTGRMVDGNGAPVANESILLGSKSGPPQQATTDDEGNFFFAVTRGGTYSVSTAHHNQHTRVWTSEAAPPSASQGLLIVAETDAVERGQCNCQNGQCNCQNSQPQRRTPNRRRRRLLARIGFKGATLPFTLAGAFGAAAAVEDEDEEGLEDGSEVEVADEDAADEGADSGDSGSAS